MRSAAVHIRHPRVDHTLDLLTHCYTKTPNWPEQQRQSALEAFPRANIARPAERGRNG